MLHLLSGFHDSSGGIRINESEAGEGSRHPKNLPDYDSLDEHLSILINVLQYIVCLRFHFGFDGRVQHDSDLF